MLEVFALILFCRLIGRILRPAGVRPVAWQAVTVGLWFLGEFLGFFLGYVLFGPGRHGEVPIASYCLALLGAFAGASWAVHLARRLAARVKPNPTTCPSCGYSRAGLQAAALCPECGSAPPITSAPPPSAQSSAPSPAEP